MRDDAGMRHRAVRWLSVSVVLTTACTHSASVSRPATARDLQGRTYAVRTITEHGVTHADLEGNPTVSFGTGTFRAESGCNTISGSYVTQGRQLVTSGGTTLVACAGIRELQDRVLLQLFNAASNVRLQGKTLTLSTKDLEMVATESAR